MIRKTPVRFKVDLKQEFEAFSKARVVESVTTEVNEQEEVKKQNFDTLEQDFEQLKLNLQQKTGDTKTLKEGIKQVFDQIKEIKIPSIKDKMPVQFYTAHKLLRDLGDKLPKSNFLGQDFANHAIVQKTKEIKTKILNNKISEKLKDQFIDIWKETFPQKDEGLKKYENYTPPVDETFDESQIPKWK